MIDLLNQLKEPELQSLDSLLDACRRVDGNVPNVYPHLLAQNRSFPVNILAYEEGSLVGFLSVYFFYQQACELAIVVHPQWRRRGIASRMLRTMIPFLKDQLMAEVICTNPHGLNDTWLKALGFHYDHSEYHMQREELQPVLLPKLEVEIHKAKNDYLSELCALDEACFQKSPRDMEMRFENLLANRDYVIFAALKEGRVVGKAHIRWKEGGATFSDIAVLPYLQGKGIGSSLLAHCINYALSEGRPHLDLDVETKNLNALHLYSRLGFKVANATDYWTMSLPHLAAHFM